MCGVNGIFSKSTEFLDKIILKMNSAVSHRGPDNCGVWLDKNLGVAFGHQRLSIIDLSKAGNQPMQSHSQRFVITYNGEIYNHLDIRNEIEKNNSNIRWKGNSDTETLIEAIDYWGIEVALQKIDGMFAFGLWDKKKRCLTLVRDRIGEKPLYFGWQGQANDKVFIFGSELKALKAHPKFKGEINIHAIALQLRHNCIPAPYSIYKDIYKLSPGHYLSLQERDLIEGSTPSSKKYWSLVENVINHKSDKLRLTDKEIQEDLEKNLLLTIKKQMISDVPIGAFLSGGTDSSALVAMMQSQSNNPVKTFTIGFEQDNYDEAKYAKKISDHLKTDHTEFFVSSRQAFDIIPKLPDIYDEPFSDSSQIPTFLVSQLAKKHVKVAFSGDGADELFCGYNRYLISEKYWNILNSIPFFLRKLFASGIKSIPPHYWNKFSSYFLDSFKYHNFGSKMYKGADVLNAKTTHDLYFRLCSHWQNPTEVVTNSKEPGTLLTKHKPQLNNLNNQQQMMALDFITYLPDDILVKVDRAAMASSLETRMPFLDHKLIDYVWKIPHSLKFKNGQGKWILKKILNKYLPKNLTERPKMGFGIPIDIWLRGQLRDWAENLLDEKKLEQEGYFNSNLIRQKWKEHLSEKKNNQFQLWNVLMFQAWLENQKKN